jgi:hypothetical protein
VSSGNRHVRVFPARKFFLCLAVLGSLISFCLLVVPSAHSLEVKLQWDRNSEHEVTGCKLYYGLARGIYPYSVDAALQTSCIIGGLEQKRSYCFAVTAYTASGLESSFFNEVRCDTSARKGRTPQ